MPGNELFYEDLIRSYVDAPDFIERPWLVRRVDRALTNPGCRSCATRGRRFGQPSSLRLPANHRCYHACFVQ